jgi:O-antigen ligase
MRENPAAFPFATFINRHHFAAFMNMTIGLTLGLLYGNATKQDKRLLLIIALLLMGIALMFTGSRGGILSLFGVIAFVILANLFRRKTEREANGEEGKAIFQGNFFLIGSGLALFFLLIGSAIFFGGENNVIRGLGLADQTDISNGRLHFWEVAWQIFLHNPILGAGLDAFSISYTQFDTWNGHQRVEQAHNDYLQILADAGILGFTCLAAFIYLLYQKGLQSINNTDDSFRRGTAIGALGGIFGILVHSFFDFPLRTSSNAFFFLAFAALATVTVNPVKRHRNRNKSTA